MFIGNIISDKELDVNLNRFKVVKSISEIDERLPTLIVGWNLVKTKYGEDVDFVNRKLDMEIFWTFSKIERRDILQHDLHTFKEYCYYKLTKNIKYYFTDPLMLTYDEHKDLFNKLKLDKNIIAYHAGDMVYLYANNIIYGFNLMFYKYMGDKTDKAISVIKDVSNVFLTGTDIIKEYSDFMEVYNNDYKYIPYLYSILKNT